MAARRWASLSQEELTELLVKEDGTPILPAYMHDIERFQRNPIRVHPKTVASVKPSGAFESHLVAEGFELVENTLL